MHQSIPSENIPPRGDPRGFAPIFSPGPEDLYYLNCPGVAWGSDLLSIVKVPSCQLMPHEGTFQLQTDHLLLLSRYKICLKVAKTLSVVLKLKLEGMTKNNLVCEILRSFERSSPSKFRT